MIIYRQFGSSVWTFDTSMRYFYNDFRAQVDKRISAPVKGGQQDNRSQKGIFTVGLHSQTSKSSRVFGNKEGHVASA